ncbi:hypothetical protein N0V87_005372 [Didymella glomerata]|uniref:Uncharacterized protein n=1 Tax=Didymella glomerata TaxID=749621 RepID=A0A9W8WZL3_9PLEO|nr:hypothetical protein N0V87_005372 [Didymella glomerata]
MFVSVKERARQIASGQFTAPSTSIPAATLIDLAPEPKPAAAATSKKAGAKDTTKATAKTKLSKTAPSKDTPKATPTPAESPKATPSRATPIGAFPEPTSPKIATPPEVSTPKKSSSKSKLTKESSSKSTKEPSSKPAKEPSLKPSTPKLGSSKSTSSNRPPPSPKVPSSPKISSPTKTSAPRPSLFSRASSASKTPSTPTTPTTPTTPSKPKRAKSPPKRVDSPISDTSSSDPLSSLKSSILQQVSGITGLGGRRLAIALKQRSNGEYYVALKDVGSDKYLKMWMNRDKTSATKEEALERYLVWVGRMRNEVRWFPARERSPGKGGKK